MAKQPVQGTLHDNSHLAVLETVETILKHKGNEVWHVEPSTTVYEAVAEMAKRGIGALPVLLHGRLIGIISERDYARKIILQGRSSRETLVREIMTLSPVSVAPCDTVDFCLRLMTERRIRHLPVLERGSIVGILSIGDLVKAIIATQAFTIDQLQTYIAAVYPS
jgi:CBS domain-containing protein